MSKQQAAAYHRERTPGDTRTYSEKFSGLIKVIEDCRGDDTKMVIIAYPWVLGDTLEEIEESLGRIGEAGLTLAIAKE